MIATKNYESLMQLRKDDDIIIQNDLKRIDSFSDTDDSISSESVNSFVPVQPSSSNPYK